MWVTLYEQDVERGQARQCLPRLEFTQSLLTPRALAGLRANSDERDRSVTPSDSARSAVFSRSPPMKSPCRLVARVVLLRRSMIRLLATGLTLTLLTAGAMADRPDRRDNNHREKRADQPKRVNRPAQRSNRRVITRRPISGCIGSAVFH